KDGIRKYTTEVVCDSVQFLEPKSQTSEFDRDYGSQEYSRSYQKNDYKKPKKQESTPTIDVAEDDLPF
ncbi:MAG: single-stranded DNA-binding protein, partial [Candidatus Izimaplasma sp.]|nr:single-stranded DNA-binding protein [Candidatus Izimaplasma bacterium]